MRRCSGSVALITGIVLLNLGACRPKAKRFPAKPVETAFGIAVPRPKVPQSPSQRYFESKPIDLEALAPVRTKANAAFRTSLDKHTRPNDSMTALARALFDAPGSAVAAIELTRAAARAHDVNRFGRYARIVERATIAFPSVANVADAVLRSGAQHPLRRSAVPAPDAAPTLTRQIPGLTLFSDLCGWLRTSFREGRPPVDDVGEQDTESIECQISPVENFGPGLEAAVAYVRTGTADQRVFAWVAVRLGRKFWLSRVVAECFAPALHPQGNGFSIELQRAEAYKAGLPEVTAYIADRSTVLDVILNETVVTSRHRVVVMTFDGPRPQTSESIVLQSSISRSLIDPNAPPPPKPYKHSTDLSKTAEESFSLEWGDNRVRLTPNGTNGADSKAITLFAES
jgi:hypothetical protein